jgi:hypothetical protein
MSSGTQWHISRALKLLMPGFDAISSRKNIGNGCLHSTGHVKSAFDSCFTSSMNSETRLRLNSYRNQDEISGFGERSSCMNKQMVFLLCHAFNPDTSDDLNPMPLKFLMDADSKRGINRF